MLGYQAIPELLHRHGLTTVFAMLAETNGPWLAHGVADGLIRLVRTRHEETAVMAANGFARTTGRIGVASVTRGPGLANSVNALAAAVDTHVPVVLITAAGPRPHIPSQNLEQEGIIRLLGAGHVLVRTAAELPAALDAAMGDALWRGRPQVVSVHDDVLQGIIDLEPPSTRARASRPDVSEAAAAAAAGALLAARRPLIVAGGGALAADARGELEQLAEHTGAGLGTTLMALGMFSGHPHDVGLVGGWAPSASREYFQTVDVVCSFGATLNRFTMDGGRLFSGAAVIQCLIDPSDVRSFQVPDALLIADARHAARRVLGHVGGAATPKRYAGPAIGEIRRSLVDADIGFSASRGLDVRVAAGRIADLLPLDRIVVTDSGRAVVPLAGLIAAKDARSWVHGRGYGSIGQGLGLAIGAACAHRDRQVVLFVGDGAFLASCHDLDAARLAGIDNLLIVVLNDEMYGMETSVLEDRALPLDTISQSTPDLLALVRAYGGEGIRVETEAELGVLRIPDRRGIFLIDVRIDPVADPTRAVGDRSGQK